MQAPSAESQFMQAPSAESQFMQAPSAESRSNQQDNWIEHQTFTGFYMPVWEGMA